MSKKPDWITCPRRSPGAPGILLGCSWSAPGALLGCPGALLKYILTFIKQLKHFWGTLPRTKCPQNIFLNYFMHSWSAPGNFFAPLECSWALLGIFLHSWDAPEALLDIFYTPGMLLGIFCAPGVLLRHSWDFFALLGCSWSTFLRL